MQQRLSPNGAPGSRFPPMQTQPNGQPVMYPSQYQAYPYTQMGTQPLPVSMVPNQNPLPPQPQQQQPPPQKVFPPQSAQAKGFAPQQQPSAAPSAFLAQKQLQPTASLSAKQQVSRNTVGGHQQRQQVTTSAQVKSQQQLPSNISTHTLLSQNEALLNQWTSLHQNQQAFLSGLVPLSKMEQECEEGSRIHKLLLESLGQLAKKADVQYPKSRFMQNRSGEVSNSGNVARPPPSDQVVAAKPDVTRPPQQPHLTQHQQQLQLLQKQQRQSAIGSAPKVMGNAHGAVSPFSPNTLPASGLIHPGGQQKTFLPRPNDVRVPAPPQQQQQQYRQYQQPPPRAMSPVDVVGMGSGVNANVNRPQMPVPLASSPPPYPMPPHNSSVVPIPPAAPGGGQPPRQ